MNKALSKLILSLFVAVVFCSLPLVAFVNGQVVGESWPMFGHDLLHSGYSSSVVPLTNQTLWVTATDGEVRSSVAIAEDILYTATFGGNIYAIDARTGAILWNYKAGDNVWSFSSSGKWSGLHWFK